ncbi:MAG: ISKra4 family transposase, partial [Chroococcidiopsidaceae cyanobacterium CP_BM_RX_35]|nr:ISKra4 family transposase [Chroococcidiopsidaceae cyanobacterium CP_BM_RX_35]
MKVRVQVVIEADNGEEVIQEVAQIQKEALQPETLGLTLKEAKTLLNRVQQTFVEQQVSAYFKQLAKCPDCGQNRRRKGNRPIIYRTLFGKLHLQGTRLFHCGCLPHTTRSFSPLSDLLPERTAPELLYLESKFASLMSYGLTVKLLEEVLPIGDEINTTTMRNHLQRVAQRLEEELGEEQWAFIKGCERDWEKLPRPALPLTFGLDGGYVHSCERKSNRNNSFEIITGKSVTTDGNAKRFGLVNGYDPKPK